ncbi:MAG: arginine deiminase-related protein [Patescibacteria group bacterium]
MSTAMTLQVLMCRPTHFDVTEKDKHGNTHMDPARRPDRARAHEQYEALLHIYAALGIRVVFVEPGHGLTDMTFTANCGFVFGNSNKKSVVLSNFRPERRRGEQELFSLFFPEQLGYKTLFLPPSVYFEGSGDAIPFGDAVFVGHGFRTSHEAIPYLRAMTGKPIIPLKLKKSAEGNAIQYHLDTAMSVFEDERIVIAYRGAFTEKSYARLKRAVAEAKGKLFEAAYEDAASLALNTVVVPKKDIAPGNGGRALFSMRRGMGILLALESDTPRFRGVAITSDTASAGLLRTIETCGYYPITVPLGEFIKSGGGAFCLTKIL